MINLLKKVQVVALALAAAAAFAFNMPNNQEQYAINPNTGDWIPLSGLVEGRDYQCNQSGNCAYDAPNGNVVKSGTFVLMD
ncbi:hypothetical protein [Anditalea andensis]|uniref:Uncharacterized protein n=1 Tax=Anditalea andensis TaxID=1048983 RepID=A0A074KVL1_9BACT|nr:hypothetical protein [Anditalea andensis]KEO71598.1 hypothetical protein EL17_24115 [Anditalea andensis]